VAASTPTPMIPPTGTLPAMPAAPARVHGPGRRGPAGDGGVARGHHEAEDQDGAKRVHAIPPSCAHWRGAASPLRAWRPAHATIRPIGGKSCRRGVGDRGRDAGPAVRRRGCARWSVRQPDQKPRRSPVLVKGRRFRVVQRLTCVSQALTCAQVCTSMAYRLPKRSLRWRT
jgi:hypothetical protein